MNKWTETPTLDADGAIVINVENLIAHTLIQANSGGGKTRGLRRILEQTWGWMPHIVIDREGEFHTLREKFPYILASPSSKEAAATVKTAPLLARRLLETGASAIVDISELGIIDGENQQEVFVRAFVMALMDAPRTKWRDLILAIDEAQLFCAERGEPDRESTDAVNYLMQNGRKRGYAVILATQRISALHKTAAAECNNRLIGRTGLDVDQARACKSLGWKQGRGAELRSLKPGTFWVYGPALTDEPTITQMGDVETTHGRKVRHMAPTPPLEEARRMLAEIGDLPAEAEAELKTAEDLRARIRQLETDLDTVRKISSSPDVVVAAERAERAAMADADRLQRENTEIRTQMARLEAQRAALIEASRRIAEKFGEASRLMDEFCSPDGLAKLEPEIAPPPRTIAGTTANVAHAPVVATPHARLMSYPEMVAERAAHERTHGALSALSAMQRALLTVLAQHGRLPKGKVLVHARYAAGGPVSQCWAQMTRDGWITSDQGVVEITPKGLKVLGPYERLPVGRALLAAVLPRLSGMEQKLLTTVAAVYPRSISKGEALRRAGYAAGGPVSQAWAHLCALDYLTSDRGNVTAAKELCEP